MVLEGKWVSKMQAWLGKSERLEAMQSPRKQQLLPGLKPYLWQCREWARLKEPFGERGLPGKLADQS